jgi:hypothetical protein
MTLLYAIETYLRRTNLPPSRFGRDAVRDPRLVHDLRRGRSPGPDLERRVRDYINNHANPAPTTDRPTAASHGGRG